MADDSEGFVKWKTGIDGASGDPAWNSHDEEIQRAVNEYNCYLMGKAGYVPLDWRVVKAMLWTETGPRDRQWRSRPMQIGVVAGGKEDQGLGAFLDAGEHRDLILPPQWRKKLSTSSVRTIPRDNIMAGIGYLLMRMAKFETRSVANDGAPTVDYKVKPGESLWSIAKAHHSTPDRLKELNNGHTFVREGQIIKFQEASSREVIVGWRQMTPEIIQDRYNHSDGSLVGDENYSKKVGYALDAIVQDTPSTPPVCPPPPAASPTPAPTPTITPSPIPSPSPTPTPSPARFRG